MIKFGNDVIKFNGSWITNSDPIDPYNPLGLPPNTVRVRTSNRNAPVKGNYTTYETATLVPGTYDLFDVYKSGTNLDCLLYNSTNVIEVLGANTSNITSMHDMFCDCTSLSTIPLFDTSKVTDMNSMFASCSITSIPLFDTSKVTDMKWMFDSCYNLINVPLFDTSNVTNMNAMLRECTSLTTVPLFDTHNVTDMGFVFFNCTSLTTVPLFNTSSVTDINRMFYNCINVESGALALYQQASTQINPPTGHSDTFKNCGSNTQTGAAELAQIPTSWGGTMQ